ncbi:MAG: Crp/Fnr family transcriptional regulator [Candidatus Omnitrophica bacterium]|nr:Crp/Fnr family transcriptional regulator [Candidatus Omnitrophota bacterium]
MNKLKESQINLKTIPLFQGFSSEELDIVSKCLHPRTFKKGEMLFSEGAPCERVFIVVSGRIKLFRTASTGREQILETLSSGETCACNPGNTEWFCSSTAEALTTSQVLFLSRKDYVEIVQTNVKLSHALNEIFARRLQCFTNLIEEVSLKDVKKRLVKFLLDMLSNKHKAYQKNDALYIPFTREEIAQRLGTARETVARYLSQLKKEGLIDIKPYQIVILEKDALEKLL